MIEEKKETKKKPFFKIKKPFNFKNKSFKKEDNSKTGENNFKNNDSNLRKNFNKPFFKNKRRFNFRNKDFKRSDDLGGFKKDFRDSEVENNNFKNNVNYSIPRKSFRKKETGFKENFMGRKVYKTVKNQNLDFKKREINYKNLGRLIKKDPINNSLRMRVTIDKDNLNNSLESSLFKTTNSKAGRSNGRISVHGRKGTGKKKILNINRSLVEVDGLPGIVEDLIYYSEISAHVALVRFQKGNDIVKCYILKTMDMKIGDSIQSGKDAPIKSGNNLPLSAIPSGTFIHNLETQPGRGGTLIRSAGTYGTLISKENGLASILIPSKEIISVSLNCRASIGKISNDLHNRRKIGSAGKGQITEKKRSRVNLKSKNPVDGANTGSRQTVKGIAKGQKTGSRTKFQKRQNKKRRFS